MITVYFLTIHLLSVNIETSNQHNLVLLISQNIEWFGVMPVPTLLLATTVSVDMIPINYYFCPNLRKIMELMGFFCCMSCSHCI